MVQFLEKYYQMINEIPDHIAFVRGLSKRGITNREVEEYSGRIYNYLKSKGVGKEDFVLICLPRGVRPFVAMVGIWKAGAALTILESNYPPERIEYVRKDVNAKLVLTEEVYNEMMTYDYEQGYIQADEHDACFAIYTSGSTGNPKGVLHEYGKIDIILNQRKICEYGYGVDYSFANIAPLNFIASIGICFYNFLMRLTVHIIPYELVKNPPAFVRYIEDNNISKFFCTASYLKVLPYIPSCVIQVDIGGEVISNVYVTGTKLFNIYSCSEASYTIGRFLIDKSYPNTPVGKSLYDFNYMILDENGNEVNKGVKGEVCIKDYFTRGYINSPDKTQEVFIDGIYHMRDIGYLDDNDNLVICGRMDDMIKINGNRIEPAEIEVTLKKVLGINLCVAKGFNEPDRSYVVAYFIKKELLAHQLLDEQGNLKLTADEINNKLSQFLPYYMLPTYYIVLDAFPINANGKLYKNGLPAPDVKLEEKEYIAPTTKEEKLFCDAFEKVLELKQVGIDDDFYLIGGDSLKSMFLVAEVNDPDITITQIYKERTPRKLGKYLQEAKLQDIGNIDERNIKALEHLQPIIGDVKWAVDYQVDYQNSTMWNLPVLYQMSGDVNVAHLKESIDKVLKEHPVFSSHIIYSDDGDRYLKFDPSFYVSPKVVKLTKEEFEIEKKGLIKPFLIINKSLYEVTIYDVEGTVYLWFDIHHSISDGTSLRSLFSQFEKAYFDDKYQVEKDYYYLTVRDDYKKIIIKDNIELGKKYRKEIRDLYKLGQEHPILTVKKDFDSKGLTYAYKDFCLSAFKSNIKEDSLIKKYGSNSFFFAAYIKALSIYNGNNIGFSNWLYNGRDSFTRMNASGLMFHTYPVSIDFGEYNDFKQVLNLVNQKTQEQISNPYSNFLVDNYSFCDLSPLYIYQRNIYKQIDSKLFKNTVALDDNNKTLDTIITLQIIDNDGSDDIIVHIEYSKDILKEESIDKIFEIFNQIVKENM